jgi:RNA polymerase sigma factor (sigma-70 family)
MATDPSKTSATLLDWLRNPANSEAWEEFAKRYRQKILECCLRNRLQPADAEDIAQDLLLNIRDKMRSFVYDPARGRFRDWLSKVTKNACRDFWRTKARDPKPLPPELANLIEADLEIALDDQARTELLHIALDQVRTQVSPRDYAIFRRRVFDRIPAATVAQEQGMSVAAVDQAKYRVMTKLREIIEELGGDAADQPESGP